MLDHNVLLVLRSIARRHMRQSCECKSASFDIADHLASCQYRVNVEAQWVEDGFGTPDPAGAAGREGEVRRGALYVVQALSLAIAKEQASAPKSDAVDADKAAADASAATLRDQLAK